MRGNDQDSIMDLGNEFAATEAQLQRLLAQFQQQAASNFGSNEKKISRRRFTSDEDALLRSLVAQSGTSDWSLISQHFQSRSARQCRDRWKHYISPEVETGNWTQLDDEKLLAKVGELGPRWSQIAVFFPTRTDIGVKNHYMALKTKQLRLTEPPLPPPDLQGRCTQHHEVFAVGPDPDPPGKLPSQ